MKKVVTIAVSIALGTLYLYGGENVYMGDSFNKRHSKSKEAFNKVDLIITPTAPTTAYKIGEMIDDPIKMYLGDVFTVCVVL